MKNDLERALIYTNEMLAKISVMDENEKRFFERLLDYTSHELRHAHIDQFNFGGGRRLEVFNLYRRLGSPDDSSEFALKLLKKAIEVNMSYHDLWYLEFASCLIPVTDEVRSIYIECLWDSALNADLRLFCLDQLDHHFNSEFIVFYENHFERFIAQEYNNHTLMKIVLRDAYWAHEKIEDSEHLFSLIRNYIRETNIDTSYMHDSFLILLGLLAPKGKKK